MEAAKEQEGGLLQQILPPRLEDAGLEDCALHPDSIKEAFLKAATAVKSRAYSIFSSDGDEESEGHCIKDPWSTIPGEPTDVVVGVLPEHDPPAPCAAEKGVKLPEIGRDEVVVGGGEVDGEGSGDKVVLGGDERSEGGKACVDGWQGLEIGEKLQKKKNGGDEEAEEKEKGGEGPILAEGFA